MSSHALLTHVLDYIEENLRTRLTIMELAHKFCISQTHLKRSFKLAFQVPIARYIRLRKLTESIRLLLDSQLNIIDIACEFGFDYEQSFIRAFKREYGMTPGELRLRREILPVTPPLNLDAPCFCVMEWYAPLAER